MPARREEEEATTDAAGDDGADAEVVVDGRGLPDTARPEPPKAPVGTHDVLWPESRRWEVLVSRFGREMEAAGFGLALTPLVEDVRLFRRGIGEASEVVGKEMYEFEDRGGRRLALRPEGTAPIARAFVQHRPPLPWKAWYVTPAFRYERPQAGRYRQHHQLGVEALGSADADLDVEVVCLAWDFMTGLGLGRLALHLNSMGCSKCRPVYAEVLERFLEAHASSLCSAHRERHRANPLRVLDCKTVECREVSASAPRLPDYLCDECRSHIGRVMDGLGALQVPFEMDHLLVRGLDYYTRTTFEIRTSSLSSAQDALGGGGRYDDLVEAIGGPPTPAVGFGTGIERLLLACDAEGCFEVEPPRPDAFVVDLTGGEAARDITTALRRAGLSVQRSFDSRSARSQMRAADRSGALVAVIVGEREQAEGTVTLRHLDGSGRQEVVGRFDLLGALRGLGAGAGVRVRSMVPPP
jgi:histidyl-tRNA synthetase